MKLGYACINETLKTRGLKFQAMRVSQFKQYELLPRIRNNFRVVYEIMKWNAENGIHLYRFSSDLVPLATHELNQLEWWKDSEVLKYCKLIRETCKQYNIQTSLHPDQFVVLNSPTEKVIEDAFTALRYHYKLCKLLDCKLILLHCGGIYGDKVSAARRLITNFRRLPKQLQELLYFENDDKSYNLEETLRICEYIKRPIVVDWHHDRCLPSKQHISVYIDRILATWQNSDLEPKLHLSSSQDPDKLIRNHAEYVTLEDYKQCVADTQGKFNIMFECKAKELSVLDIRSRLD